ncbi:hypothetical protein [Kitasatospora sp. GP82]|uniref:hypothetical protein n=1 Tax=Kitasatospora sp. GP82 TaxID=3035089 RepID=UPI002473BC95|nr:hypothetical protein [Kitasatospora sp. GP82]MDH6128235.1 hypothetical protein [Kitasatospora sp. GP82]
MTTADNNDAAPSTDPAAARPPYASAAAPYTVVSPGQRAIWEAKGRRAIGFGVTWLLGGLLVDSYTKGEFNVTHQSAEGDETVTRTYVFGGVDFTGVSFLPASPAQFRTQWPQLTDQVRTSLGAPAQDPQAGQAWLGKDTLGSADLTGAETPSRVWTSLQPAMPWLLIAVGIATLAAMQLVVRRHTRHRPGR